MKEEHEIIKDETYMLESDELKFKGKYHVHWCGLCGVATICCEKCNGSTCNGHGCEECNQDFDEFNQGKRHISDYLKQEESEIYRKGLELQRFIRHSLGRGEKEIDFKKLKEQGHFSNRNQEILKDLIGT